MSGRLSGFTHEVSDALGVNIRAFVEIDDKIAVAVALLHSWKGVRR